LWVLCWILRKSDVICWPRGPSGTGAAASRISSTRTPTFRLSATGLGLLIRGGEENLLPIYDLILGVLGMGSGARFYDLEGSEKMYVMDISIFLLDQLRFESMKRLGWVEDFPTRHISLLDLVEQFGEHFFSRRHETPFLSPSHSLYGEYEKTFEGDRSLFVRRLIPDALQAYIRESEKS